MKGASVFIFLGLWTSWANAQFLNHRPFPTYSLENMPDTDFSCRDKILGGYYADAETQCQMFHICVKVAGIGIQDFRFLCPNGTAFDQDHQICAEWEDVDCDSTTLYYASDNFDLYRIGSGFESKAVKYGEDEETFALQRAETGDARLNREHQAQRVNQQKEQQFKKNRPQQRNNNNNNNNNNEKDIFKGSSSSNFFNNKNGGKENDEDYDDNVNVNQNNDNVQKRKLIRKQPRRPVQNNNENRRPEGFTKQPNPQNEQSQNQNNQRRPPQQQNRQNEDVARVQPRPQPQNRQNEDVPRVQQRPQNQNRQNEDVPRVQQRPQPQNRQNEDFAKVQSRPNEDVPRVQPRPKPQEPEPQTSRPPRPTGFINNFAGSSYVPTTSRPTSTTLNNDQYTTAVNNHKNRNGQRVRVTQQYNNADNFRSNPSTPQYTVSTPAPFKQTQYNNPPARQSTPFNNNGQYSQTTQAPLKSTENYPTNFPKQTQNYKNDYSSTTAQKNYPTQAADYDVQKVKSTKQENYPTTPYKKPEGNFANQFSKKATTVPDNYPTTFAPKYRPSTANFNNNQQNNFNNGNNNYNNGNNNYNNGNNNFNNGNNNNNNFPSTFAPRTNAAYTQVSQQTTQYKNNNNNNFNQQNQQPSSNFNQQSTPRTTPFTQYTPTVPKITSTTPVARANRYDETQYDDGSYDGRKDDEFLKTAHSQNIASSRNEFAKGKASTQRPQYESPRPFSVSPNTPRNNFNNNNNNNFEKTTTQAPAVVNNSNNNNNSNNKKVKDASYDYAYYDTNVGSEPEYEIDTEIKKSTAKN